MTQLQFYSNENASFVCALDSTNCLSYSKVDYSKRSPVYLKLYYFYHIGPGGLSLAIEGPSEAKLVCKDNKDGTCTATYVPEESGEYDVHVKYADEHVPGSPFKVKASRPVDASKVKCFGPGVDKAPLFESAPTHFTVDTAEAGDAPLDVVIETPDRKKIKPDEVKKVDDNTYEVQYTPPKEGENLNLVGPVVHVSFTPKFASMREEFSFDFSLGFLL